MVLDQRARELSPKWTAATLRFAAPLVGGVLLAFFLQLVLAPAAGKYWEKLLIDAGINIILAVSLNLVNGFTGQFSIGHAGFMAVGGYAAGCLVYYGSWRWFGSAAIHGGFLGGGDLLFLGGCLLGGLVAAACGWVVGLPSLRLRGDYLAIVTLGFGEILRVILQRSEDVLYLKADIDKASSLSLIDNLGGSLGFTGLPFYTTVFWVFVFVTITLVVSFRIKESSFGRAMLSIRENEIAAEAMGINTTRYKVRAFVIAAFFAGIAGGLFAHEKGVTLNPRELGFQKSFDIVIMVVLGGMGSVSGAVLAAVILTLLPELLREFNEYRMIFYALALIVMMIVRPQGLFGVHEIWEGRFWKRFRRAS
jgi:branched-chain amino acid transport system permease protein